MIKLSELKISKEDDHDIWCFCPNHADNKTPNFLVSKTGKYAGYGKCFACGYYVKVDMEGRRKIVKAQRIPNPINWNALNELYKSNYMTANKPFIKWNVTPDTLKLMNIGFDGEAHTFPVFKNRKTMVGIQRIFNDNSKKLVHNSRIGMFIPHSYTTAKDYTVITEGVSDTAMAVDLNLNVIGRLSANCCEDIITDIFRNLLVKDRIIIILADRDSAGINGATKLATYLTPLSEYVKILVPQQGNDLREWVSIDRNEADEYFNYILSTIRLERTIK